MRKEGQKGRGKREERRERNKIFYIICWYSLYYFNEFYVKIKTEMLDKL